jgi:hypothetical protein
MEQLDRWFGLAAAGTTARPAVGAGVAPLQTKG